MSSRILRKIQRIEEKLDIFLDRFNLLNDRLGRLEEEISARAVLQADLHNRVQDLEGDDDLESRITQLEIDVGDLPELRGTVSSLNNLFSPD
jgi:chromosome segregation ATPase